MSSIDQALATFEPISLEGANDIAELQTRVDRKYLVDESTLLELLDALAPTVRVLEVDGRHECDYSSTYFDTEEFALYRAAVQGRRHRFKIRSRTYGDTGPCFLEVKAKGGRGGSVKSRVSCARNDHDGITGDGFDFVTGLIGDAQLAAALRPVLTTDYTRSTLIDWSDRTRLTFDRHLRCTDTRNMSAVLEAVVVETKSTGAPSAADRWLWRHRVRPTKVSKFCTGLAVIRPELPANKWHRVIDRHWQQAARDPTCSAR
ncbi:MAG: polyphosphate polymerase domain-containing protein [Ilumatobacter sp.]|uniref:polyphosphate polymerase domain-containing protein n=1 Tax=Ilumatobacter sp. TaxID=1967498 RepID=UPI003C790D9E